MKIGLIDFVMASLQIAFIVLKLCGTIEWSWFFVLLPTIIFVARYVFALIILLWWEHFRKRKLKQTFGTTNPLQIRLKMMEREREKIQKEREELERKRKEMK